MLLTHGGLVFMESAPVIIVFTKYDRLVRTKRVELQEDDDSLSEDVLRERSKEEARKVLDVCIQSLEHTLGGMQTSKSQTLKAHHVNVSGIKFPTDLFKFAPCVNLSPQTNRATKLPSRLSLKSLATSSVTSSN